MTTPTPEDRERALRWARRSDLQLLHEQGNVARVLLALDEEKRRLEERVTKLEGYERSVVDAFREYERTGLIHFVTMACAELAKVDALAQQPKETTVETKPSCPYENPDCKCTDAAHQAMRASAKPEPYRPKVGERARLESSPDPADTFLLGKILLIKRLDRGERKRMFFNVEYATRGEYTVHRDATWSPVASDPVATETREERLRRLGYEDTRPEGGCADALGLKRPEEIGPVAVEKPTGEPSDDELFRLGTAARYSHDADDSHLSAQNRAERRALFEAGRASEAAAHAETVRVNAMREKALCEKLDQRQSELEREMAAHAETKRVLRAMSELASAREKQRDEAEAELERVRGELAELQGDYDQLWNEADAEIHRELTAAGFPTSKVPGCIDGRHSRIQQAGAELVALREGRPEPAALESLDGLQCECAEDVSASKCPRCSAIARNKGREDPLGSLRVHLQRSAHNEQTKAAFAALEGSALLLREGRPEPRVVDREAIADAIYAAMTGNEPTGFRRASFLDAADAVIAALGVRPRVVDREALAEALWRLEAPANWRWVDRSEDTVAYWRLRADAVLSALGASEVPTREQIAQAIMLYDHRDLNGTDRALKQAAAVLRLLTTPAGGRKDSSPTGQKEEGTDVTVRDEVVRVGTLAAEAARGVETVLRVGTQDGEGSASEQGGGEDARQAARGEGLRGPSGAVTGSGSPVTSSAGRDAEQGAQPRAGDSSLTEPNEPPDPSSDDLDHYVSPPGRVVATYELRRKVGAADHAHEVGSCAVCDRAQQAKPSNRLTETEERAGFADIAARYHGGHGPTKPLEERIEAIERRLDAVLPELSNSIDAARQETLDTDRRVGELEVSLGLTDEAQDDHEREIRELTERVAELDRRTGSGWEGVK